MIIDATRGSIARFVNHSCEPNCRMVKWIVAGKPRMALFAGDRPIMTGEELTYDYNFDPFSAKNVQECRCGAASCRGVLGPKPKDKPKATATLGESIKQVVRAGKRKVEEFLKGEKNVEKDPKKRKIAVPVKRSASTKAINAAKGLKRSLSNALTSASKDRKSVIKREPSTPKAADKSQSGSSRGKKQTYLSSSRNSSLTLVNVGPSKAKAKGKGRGKGKAKEPKVESDSESSPAKAVKQVKERKLSAKAKELYRSKSMIRAIKKGQ
jgi:[histone H3]-lysine4 N-trimethyltransferase ASH1L